MKKQVFSAVVKMTGINPYIEVPANVSQALVKTSGRKGFIPVWMKLKGRRFQANVVPIGKGRHVLYLNLQMRLPTNTKVGDKITIALAHDASNRALPIPSILRKALKEKSLWERFLQFPPSHRKEFIRYLQFLKTKDSRLRAVQKIITHVRKQRMWFRNQRKRGKRP